MSLLKPRWSVLCLFLFLVLSMGQFAVEYLTIGSRHTLQLIIPLMWILLSLGFTFTLYDTFRGLYAYDIIPESLQLLYRFGWRDWSVFNRLLLLIIPLSAISAAWDTWLRKEKFIWSWTVDYPWYCKLFLDVGALLYGAFILVQGLYLIAVALRMDKKMITEHMKREGVWERVESLLQINFIFLCYDIIWAFTIIQKESYDYFLYSDVFSLGTFGLLLFHIVSIILWYVLLKDHTELAATEEKIQIHDHPTKFFLNIFRLLYWFFLFLSAVRWVILRFNLQEITNCLPVLFLAFLVVGITSIGCKIWLIWNYIVAPNIKYPWSNKYEVKHWSWAFLLVLTMISSLVVIIHLGKDSYDLQHPMQQAALFQFFLSVYVVAHMVLVLFEGVVAMWQLLFEDIIKYHGQDSAQCRGVYDAQARNVAKDIHMECRKASRVFAIYSVLFVLGLPQIGINMHTLIRILAGPSLFHLAMMIAYFTFQKSCLKPPQQQQQEGQASTPVQNRDLRHNTELLVDRFPYRSSAIFCVGLLFLSIFRWVLVNEVQFLHIPAPLKGLSTNAIRLAYLFVCIYWLRVMYVYLSCIIIIKKSFYRIWQILRKCSAHKYPQSVLIGICCLAMVILAVEGERQRYMLTSKWAHDDWSPCLGIPLVIIHAGTLICQGLLLSGAIIASDTTRKTKEEENVPFFDDSLGYLMVINVFLLIEHALFIFYTHTDVWEVAAFGLIVYHAGSCCIIVFLWQTQCKENTVPSDATSDDKNESKSVHNRVWVIPGLLSPCFNFYRVITSEPLRGTFYCVSIMLFLDMGMILDRFLPPTECRNILIVVFQLFTSFTFGVANYYIGKYLTSSTAYDVPVGGKRWDIRYCTFLLVILLLAVTEIICSVTYQITFPIENLALGTSLLIGCLNVILVLHEGYAIFLLAIQNVRIGKSHDKARIIELILTLNYYYAAFGVFSSILVWTNRHSSLQEFDSVVCLLGHVACSVLVPAIVISIMERMREEVNPETPVPPEAESGNDTMVHGSQESSAISRLSVPTEGHEAQQSGSEDYS